MWQEIITGIILCAASFYAARSVFRKKKNVKQDCNACHSSPENCQLRQLKTEIAKRKDLSQSGETIRSC